MSNKRVKPIAATSLPVDPGRWICLDGADRCLASAARFTLRARLDAVRRYLPLAAFQSGETSEHVHRLRVSTRRVIAALKLYNDLLPKRKAAWLRRRMKQIRSVAGAARDLDVLTQRYQQSDVKKYKRLIRRLRRSRLESQHAIIRLHRSLIESGILERRAAKLVDRIRCDGDLTLQDFARTSLGSRADRFFNLATGDLKEVEQLHRFRIQAKELRYTIELLRDALPREVAKEIYPVICKTQDILGELNDHSIAAERLRHLARREKRPKAKKRFKKLCREEKDRVGEARTEFRSWWTPEFVVTFESDLRRLLDMPSSEPTRGVGP